MPGGPVSPYEGRTLQGVVRSTWLQGPITTDTPEGRLLSNRDHHRKSTS